ncbi:MAG: S-layer homology domain-containing protein [Chloroflexota bacterium]
MKKSKVMQIGFAVAALFLLLIGMASMNASASLPVGQRAGSATDKAVEQQMAAGKPLVRTAERSGVSLPLREYPAINTGSTGKSEDNENPKIHRPDPGKPVPPGSDAAIRQTILGPLAMPTPIVNFDGIYNQNGFIPPDTNGDVGRNQYVQTVNSNFEVWNKSGVSEYGPVNINILWTGLGGSCEANNDGDPITIYDPMAGRWLISQFTDDSHQCIAISTSEDATGSYYRYDFFTGYNQTVFEDYPHFGVWPDAYYMTTNEFDPGFVGGGHFAFERDRMLQGDPSARFIYFHGLGGGYLPSDMDGAMPPAGTPNFVVGTDTLATADVYKFHVDWATPGNSTFTGPTSVAITPFTQNNPGAHQPGTSVRLDPLNDRLMFRLAYRNMGSYESLVANFTVDAGAYLGVRWLELRNPNGAVTLHQEGTFAPADNTDRWMGSAAMDRQGNIAVGYSASSTTVYPSLRYAGRLAGDPLGQLAQGEATLFAGSGSETNASAPRWGDYSDLTVDPVDDCTFWYTNEYFAQTGPRNWRTRIGSFKFPGCTGGTSTPVPTSTAPYVSPTSLPATATPCPGAVSFTGTITNTDPTQNGRVNRGHPPSTCLNPSTGVVQNDGFVRHYDTHSYTNSTGSTQCVTIRVDNACGDNTTGSAAYLNTFDPNNLAANYLGDYGDTGGPSYSYSVSVPAGQTLVVVVHELSPNLGCATYTVSMSPCALPPTSTVTSTPSGPTNTPQPPTATPTTVCTGTTYQTFASTGSSIITATNDIGNHCDDCVTNVTLPFPVTVYGTPYTSANVGSNGNLNFNSAQQNIYQDNCLPVQSNNPQFASTLFAYYTDLRTDVMTGTHGIYTDVIGTSPNRQFVIRWQAAYFDTAITDDANFEVVLTENSPVLSVIYGSTGAGGAASSGIQLNLGQYTSYSCQTDIPEGTRVDYVPIGCGVTPTATAAAATATPTACTIEFEDVLPGNTFYPFIKCLACRNIINGYPCGGTGEPCNPNNDPYFRPSNFVTRGQLTKIVSQSAGFSEPVSGQTFEDVLPGSTFYTYTERLASRGVMGGYPCGIDPNEPCVLPGNKPYFRPSASATRGQLTKIVSNAAGFNDPDPATFTFTDVPPGSTFHVYVERLLINRPGAMNGYPCGSPGEPCDSQSRPYFRPGATLSRGQTSKIVANTFFPNCQTPARK